jgi:hypothetical protein
MHAGGSTLSIWLPALYKLTAEQYLEALRMDYSVSIARTVAGVHYPQDIIAGLNVGQRIIREQLPAYMKDNYGYDRKKVKKMVQALSFDWNDFDSLKGEIKGVSAAKFLEDAMRGKKVKAH